jgi:hypothetical protein
VLEGTKHTLHRQSFIYMSKLRLNFVKNKGYRRKTGVY